MGRRKVIETLDQATVGNEMNRCDILSNCRQYPKDEAPDAYKGFDEVLKSVELARLAKPVAKLKARFVMKNDGPAND